MITIQWGIIGCGDVTEVKSGPGLQNATSSSLVAVMRRRRDLAKDYARRHGVFHWYDTAEALLHDPDVDAVYIATPPAFHKDYTDAQWWRGPLLATTRGPATPGKVTQRL